MLPFLDMGTQVEHSGFRFHCIIALDMDTQDGHRDFERPALLLTVWSSDDHTITCLRFCYGFRLLVPLHVVSLPTEPVPCR